jgi:hypothetical protein
MKSKERLTKEDREILKRSIFDTDDVDKAIADLKKVNDKILRINGEESIQ